MSEMLSRVQLEAGVLSTRGDTSDGWACHIYETALAYLQRAEDAEKQRDESEESARMMQDRLQRLIDGARAAEARCAKLREAATAAIVAMPSHAQSCTCRPCQAKYELHAALAAGETP